MNCCDSRTSRTPFSTSARREAYWALRSRRGMASLMGDGKVASAADERDPPPLEERLQRPPGLLGARVPHAAEVAQRTGGQAPERAGLAVEAGEEERVALEGKHPRVGGPEDGEGGHSQPPRNVHRSAVVGDKRTQGADDSAERRKIQLADQVGRAGSLRQDRSSQFRFGAGSGDDDLVTGSGEARGQ